MKPVAGSGGSLALNLTFTPVSYTAFVHQLLDTLLTREAGWRGPEPLLPLPGGAGQLDPAGVAAVQAELHRAAAALQALSGDSAAVVRLWQFFVQNPNPGQAMPFTPPITTPEVLPAQRLRVRDRGQVIAMLAEGGACLCIGTGRSRTFEAEGDALHFVRRVLSAGEFRASDCLGWGPGGEAFEWSDVQMMLTHLAREGLIEIAD